MRVHVRIEARFYNLRQLAGQKIPINREGCVLKFNRRYELRSTFSKRMNCLVMKLYKDKKVIGIYTDDYDFYCDLAIKLNIPIESEYQHVSQVAPLFAHENIHEPHYFNFNNPLGMVAGFCKRVCHKVEFDEDEMKSFRSFVTRFINKNYTRLPHIDLSHDNLDRLWLDGSHYNTMQKNRFHEALERFLVEGKDKDFYSCKAFIKKEPYAEYKFPRIINSRSDQFKAVVAPLVHLMEEQVCVNEHTIKHKEKHQFTQRMQDIQLRFGTVYETDYSSFEGSFSREFQMSCEYQLMCYMLADNPEVLSVIKHVYKCDNVCFWNKGVAIIPGSRMSGEMWTSSMNGFSNRMLFEYTCYKNSQKQQHPIDYDFIVEGDDGLLATSRAIDLSYVNKLGFKLKVAKADSINELSFCGINVCEGKYVPDVSRTLQNITFSLDPGTASSVRRRKEMIHARGLSLMVESSGIPILQELAIKLLSFSNKYNIRDIDWWLRMNMFSESDWALGTRKFIAKYKRPVTMEMRRFVEQKYKISVASQFKMEKQIKNITLNDILESRSIIYG